jgi:hypothetical protein
MNHEIGRWLFFRPWWSPAAETLASRATVADIESGAWPFNEERATTASLNEIEAWLADRSGCVSRHPDSVEWWPITADDDFEAYLRWWPAKIIAAR